MAYCDVADVLGMISEGELAQLTVESGIEPDELVVAEAIGKADAEIDVYVGMAYTVPLSPVPAVIQSCSVDMAIYHLFSRRTIAPDVRRQKYEDAVALLKLIGAGKATLTPAATPATEISITSNERLFTRETMGGW